jgi:NAD(P)-dependent dehydrogenase (short-subunit alcohol dehydrogenase family)
MSQKKVALVTGANKGLGLEIARQLLAKGITVVLGARTLAKAEEAAASLKSPDAHAVQIDVTSATDIAALPEFFKEKFGQLDILVNNAGVNFEQVSDPSAGRPFSPAFEGEITGDTLLRTYQANVIGPFEISRVLLPLLKESSAGRIVNQSSILGSLATIKGGYGGAFATPGYCSSKAALNMLTVILALQLKDTRVKVNAAHPGWVKTDMGGSSAQLDVKEGAKTAVDLALLPDDGPTGGFVHLGKTLPW